MSFGRLKIDEADRLFSLYVRKRDKNTCIKCQRIFRPGEAGLTCSHFFGRGKESVRFDLENCDALCYPGCHLYWQNQAREEYRQFKIRQLGQRRFDLLLLRSNTYAKKDRAMQKIIWRQMLKELENPLVEKK